MSCIFFFGILIRAFPPVVHVYVHILTRIHNCLSYIRIYTIVCRTFVYTQLFLVHSYKHNVQYVVHLLFRYAYTCISPCCARVRVYYTLPIMHYVLLQVYIYLMYYVFLYVHTLPTLYKMYSHRCTLCFFIDTHYPSCILTGTHLYFIHYSLCIPIDAHLFFV